MIIWEQTVGTEEHAVNWHDDLLALEDVAWNSGQQSGATQPLYKNG